MESNALVKTLTVDAYNYYCSAKKYYMENELEGALINFLLALNNLKNVKKVLGAAAAATPLSCDDPSQCISTCDGVEDVNQGADQAIAKILSYVRPLQEQLKRIKNERAFGQKKDDEVPCKDVRQVLLEGDDAAITFDDVSGQDAPKNQIRNGILYPLLYPRLFPNLSKGILFYGPPGTGKTLLARAFVNQLQIEADKADDVRIRLILYAPKGSDLKGKYVGETEKKISAYFKCASAAATSCAASTNNKVVSVIFIDEVEAIAGNRSEDPIMTTSVNALLQEMDGVVGNPNVVVMAATNYPWKLDEAVLRRFDTKIYIKLPTATDIVVSIKTEFTNKFLKKALKSTVTKKKTDPADIDPTTVLSEVQNKCSAASGGTLCQNDTICLQKFTGSSSTMLKPVEIFNFYRQKYFSTLDDQTLTRFATQLQSLNFSGGDVSNLCKKVFKSMGDEARRNGRFTPTPMEDPTKLVINATNPKQVDYQLVPSVCGGEFMFHLFDPKNGISTNTDELDYSKCIFLYKNSQFLSNRVNKIEQVPQQQQQQQQEKFYEADNTTKISNQAMRNAAEAATIERERAIPQTDDSTINTIVNMTSDDLLLNDTSSSSRINDVFVDLECVPFKQFGTAAAFIEKLCNSISLLISCRNDSQKCFYISLDDLHTAEGNKSEIPDIRILIKQVLNRNDKITHFNIKKDIFVLISLSNTRMNEWYNPYNVGGTVRGATGKVLSWLSWLNFINPAPINFDIGNMTPEETVKKDYYAKLTALKDAPETLMEQIYMQATHIICLEEQFETKTTQSKIFALSALNIQGNQSKFYKCLSRGDLFNEKTTTCKTLISMFRVVQQSVLIEDKTLKSTRAQVTAEVVQPLRKIMDTSKTLNDIVFHSGLLPAQKFSFLLDSDTKTTPSGASTPLEYKNTLKTLREAAAAAATAVKTFEISTNVLGFNLEEQEEEQKQEEQEQKQGGEEPFQYNMLFMIKDIDAAMATTLMATKILNFIQSSSSYGYQAVPADAELSYDNTDNTTNVICKIGEKWFPTYTFQTLHENEPSVAKLTQDKTCLMYKTGGDSEANKQETTCAEDETNATRKITLNANISYFTEAINFRGNVDSIKPTVQIEAVQALDDYAANKKKK